MDMNYSSFHTFEKHRLGFILDFKEKASNFRKIAVVNFSVVQLCKEKRSNNCDGLTEHIYHPMSHVLRFNVRGYLCLERERSKEMRDLKRCRNYR